MKDIVIPVLGPTGSGKSTFVNKVIGTEKMEVGHGPNSCTTKPSPAYVIPIPPSRFPNLEGHRLVLLDTPGFDDTFGRDSVILPQIAEWLGKSHSQGALLGGVLYLHDITTTRMNSTACQSLETFKRICGKDAMKKAVLVITNWDSDTIDEFCKQERERAMTEEHWKPIIQQGAKVHRFLRTRDSAWAIIEMLLKSADHQEALLLQKEIVDHKIPYSKTEAGSYAILVEEKKQAGRKEQKNIMDRLGDWGRQCVIQ